MTMWGPFHPFQTHLRTRNNQPWSVALLFDSPEKSHGAPQPTQHLPPPCLFFVVGVCVPLFFSVLSSSQRAVHQFVLSRGRLTRVQCAGCQGLTVLVLRHGLRM